MKLYKVSKYDKMITTAQIKAFERDGFLVVENLLNLDEVKYFRGIYEDFLSGEIETNGHRSDLSGTSNKQQQERIIQIMRPSLLYRQLQNCIIHQRAGKIAQALLGNDLALDFDMLIDKPPHSNAPTPWHQDSLLVRYARQTCCFYLGGSG